MSRLVLKPKLVLSAVDPGSGYDVTYDSSSRILKIGCQEHLLVEWKRNSKQIIADALGVEACGTPGCRTCRHYRVQMTTYPRRLAKLIKNIERAEAGLRRGLRAQTKARD